MTIAHRPWPTDDEGKPELRTAKWYGSAPRTAPRWPGPVRKKEPETYDAETRRLMRLYNDMYRLQESDVVVPLLEDWKWREKMQTAAEKQSYLEPLIARVKKAPDKNRGHFIFLLLVFEGVRRGVEKRLLSLRSGLDDPMAAPAVHQREEAIRLQEIERDRLAEVTRVAVFEAIYRYPSPAPKHLFGWLRETVAHFTLDFLATELAELKTSSLRAAQAEAMQAFLGGFKEAAAPALGEEGGFRKWHFGVRWLYEPVGQYMNHHEVRSVCRSAVDRLPRRQREVINGEFYEGATPDEIAAARDISRSTVYNSKAQALSNLYGDDQFFMALCGMELVRDAERKAQLLEQHPDGRLKDGRRRVPIEQAA